MEKNLPTIAELEAILEEKNVEIEIAPNGEVSVKKPPCPQCARFREKLDREKLARILHRYDTAADSLSWEETDDESQGEYLKWADALIRYLEGR